MNEILATMSPAQGNALPDAIDELPLPYIELDAQGMVTRANRATLALYPTGQGELIGKMAWELVAKDEKEASCAAYVEFMKTGEGPPLVLRSIFDHTGEFRSYEMHRSVMRDAEGRPIGMRMIGVNVTQMKRSLEEATHGRIWMENVLRSMAEGVIVTDALGFVRYANPAAEALLGWKVEELKGKVIEKVVPLLSYVSGDKTHLNFTMALESYRKGIATILDRERHELRVEIGTSPMIDKDSGYTTGVVSVLRKLE
jgi:PAS domain S-box-containing protein